MKYKNFPSWYDPEYMIKMLTEKEQYLLDTFENLQDPALIKKYQRFLTRIAFEKGRICQLIKENQ